LDLRKTVSEAPAPDRMTAPGLFPLRESGSGSSGGARIFVVRTTRVHPPKAFGGYGMRQRKRPVGARCSDVPKRACCRYQSLVLYLLVQRG
jgi:hypothetical protein